MESLEFKEAPAPEGAVSEEGVVLADDVFGAMLIAHKGNMINVAKRMGYAHAQAEDVAQDVIGKLWEKRGAYRHRSEAGFRGFIATVTRRHILSVKRRKREKMEFAGSDYIEDLAPTIAAPTPSVEVREDLRRALQYMSQLSPEQEGVLALTYLGYSIERISLMVGTEEGTVKSRVSRGRAELRRLMDREITTAI